MEITEKLIPVPSKRRPGIAIKAVKFLTSHDTGNDNSTAIGNVDYFIRSADEMEASAHYFVDDLRVIRCVPEDEKAYHVRRVVTGDNETYDTDAIDSSIGIELCYGTKWGQVRNLQAYNNYVSLHVDLCVKYDLDPEKDIIAHATLDPSRRTDPHNAFKVIGVTWEQFISDIVKNMPKKLTQEIINEHLSEPVPATVVTDQPVVVADNKITTLIKKVDMATKNTKTIAGVLVTALGIAGLGDVFTAGELAETINTALSTVGLILVMIGRLAVALRSK